MVIWFKYGVGEGFIGVSVVFYDNVILQHGEFVSHELQI